MTASRAFWSSPTAGRARCGRFWGDHERFVKTYFSDYKGYYFSGDGCRRDEEGDYWITGRVDDVINVSGHRMGTAEVESALVAHETVSEAAVVGYPHPIKGQGIYCYVTLMNDETPSDELKKTLSDWVRQEIGPIAKARRHPVGPRPAQDALGQDHAPHPAQDRRERLRQPWRHLDAGRSVGRGRTHREPREPVRSPMKDAAIDTPPRQPDPARASGRGQGHTGPDAGRELRPCPAVHRRPAARRGRRGNRGGAGRQGGHGSRASWSRTRSCLPC